MKTKQFIINFMFLLAISIFLIVTAPLPLPATSDTQAATVDVNYVFEMLEAENDAARATWTKDIVKPGKRVGLEFSEDWREKELDAGPLPALFLRETAKNMERNPLRLSLFLGSDFPISPSNKFIDIQLAKFNQLKKTAKPQFFLQKDTALYTAMFADMAISPVCVDCHNDHKDSAKKDWKLNEMMGATTWMYPKQAMTLKEAMALLNLLRNSIKTAYSRYVNKAATFKTPPDIGKKWPEQGYYLPDANEFMSKVKSRASVLTLNLLLEQAENKYTGVAK